MKINVDVENDVIYKYVIFYDDIVCIVGYIKITNSHKICRELKYTYSDLYVVIFV
jgi:hypothetical protein